MLPSFQAAVRCLTARAASMLAATSQPLRPQRDIARGAYFAEVLDEQRGAVPVWEYIPADWHVWLAHDFGSAAPSVTYVLAESPCSEGRDCKWYPRGSIVAVDELATNRSDDRLNDGIGWTVPVLSEAIRAMCSRWRMRPSGVADDSIFAKTGSSTGRIADEFKRAGVHFEPAQKGDRVSRLAAPAPLAGRRWQA